MVSDLSMVVCEWPGVVSDWSVGGQSVVSGFDPVAMSQCVEISPLPI